MAYFNGIYSRFNTLKMKKTGSALLLIVFLFAANLTLAQSGNTKALEKFTKVKAYDRIIVTLVKSSENKLVISGDDKDEVSISNSDGVLKIKMEFDNFMAGGEALATLYYTETLDLIDANENAKIKSEETISGNRVEIKAQEGGIIDLKVNITDLYAKSISGSEVTLSGNAKTQEVMVNTGGKIYNKNLITIETTAVVNAGGRADINATQKVNAKVRAGGYIYIYGNPKDVNKDTVFGGKIEIVE